VAVRVFGQRVGVVTGVLCALYWVLAYFDGELLLPVLLVPLVLLAFLLLFAGIERRSLVLISLAGLIFGFYAITRPNIVIFFPFAAWWVWRALRSSHRKRRLITTGLFAVGCALPPLGVTLRNGIVGNDWVFIASQGGVNFYIGNNPDSNGMQAVVPGTRQTWWGGYEDTVAIAEQAAGRPLKPSEISRYWFGRAFDYISTQPGHWLKLTARKALALVGDVELANNEPYEARRSDYWTLSAVPLSFGVIFSLFVAGLWPGLWPNRDRGAALPLQFSSLLLQFMLIYALTIVAFFVTGRYRVPLLPFVMMGAAATLVGLFDAARARRMPTLFVRLAVCLALFLLLRVDHFDVRASTRGFVELSTAQDLLDVGDAEGAVSKLEQIRRDRAIRVPEVYASLVRAYFKRNQPGDMAKIESVVREGLAEYPKNAELLWAAVLCEGRPGRELALLQATDRYLEQRPDDVRALNLAFGVALRVGNRDRASQYLSQAETAEPNDPRIAAMRRKLVEPD
jgi:hypothetical protein